MTISLDRSTHAASLYDGEVVEQSDLGSIQRLTADNFPILQGLSIKRLVINPGAMRTPHWHANANELTYCVKGSALVSVLDNGSRFASFTISAGEMFHVDSGSLRTTSRTSAPNPPSSSSPSGTSGQRTSAWPVHSAR